MPWTLTEVCPEFAQALAPGRRERIYGHRRFGGWPRDQRLHRRNHRARQRVHLVAALEHTADTDTELGAEVAHHRRHPGEACLGDPAVGERVLQMRVIPG